MKNWRAVAILLLCLALVGVAGCQSFGGDQEEVSQELVKVVRGDLLVSVSGSGNMVVANEAGLVFGTGGRIDRIFIEEGDEVNEGEVLARLDTGPLELALTQAEMALTQAKVSRTQTQLAQGQVQVDLIRAEAALTQAQAAQAQAEAARAQAQIALDAAEDNLEDTEDYLDWLKRTYDRNDLVVEEGEWQFEVAKLQLEAAQFQYEGAELQVEAAGSQLDAAQLQYEGAELQLETFEPQLAAADLHVEVAEQALTEAQKQLDMAALTAPFDGAVVSVEADEGDTVSPTTQILYLIDLSSIELKAGVDEIDIPDVELNQRAIISLDALPDLQLEGEVSSISLVPVVEGGLVMYDVTISFNVAEDTNLRIGMSATADIVIDERSNALLVPNRAITRDSQGNPIVKVIVDEDIEEIEERPVVLGMSDDFQTEIVDGLEEGEVLQR
ncbi:HlyD family secretion protein [Chloroflexota bacterium]